MELETADVRKREREREHGKAVSYTHLDVYKRQCYGRALPCRQEMKRSHWVSNATGWPGFALSLIHISLCIRDRIKADPGQTLAHVEFTRDGRYALASLWEMDGALLVIDTETLKVVKRIPAKKPVGKYNVWNKITRSEGTSH